MTLTIAAEACSNDMTAMIDALAQGRTTPATLVEQAIGRASAANQEINCIAWPTFERARVQADAVPRGPLAGIPTMIKDNLAEKGLPFSWGSAALRDWTAEEDAPYTKAMTAAGLISISRSTMPELGMNAATESPLVGPTRNPWNLDYVPGGSSGGGSAAVAAGIVPIAHATDGLGSIRHGAGPCGLVGLKPSRGRNFGDETKLALTDISVNGCVSRTVRDTARWLVATQAKQPDAPFAPVPLVTAPIDRSLRIRTYDTIMRTGGAPDVSVGRVFEEAMSLLGRLGHRVGRGTLPFNGPTAARALNDFIEGRFAREFERMRETLGDVFQPDRLEHRSATLVAAGGGIDDGRFATVLRLIEDNVAAYLDGFNDFDVWMTPTVSSEVVRIGAFSADSAWEKQKDALVDYAGYCWIDNFAGTPAITLPMGFSDAGLPVGIQFATRRGDEALLLALAFQLEAEMEWWRHKPPVWVGD